MPLSRKEQNRLRVLGANIRRERCAKKVTQEDLAERAEISTRNLQKVEAGQLNLLGTTLIRIQLALRSPWTKLMPNE